MVDAKIGIFGGSGFYTMFEKKVDKEVNTDYIKPSAPVSIGDIETKKVAFMPRHGAKHTLPPHKIPYKSNISAFKEVGVERIIGPCAAGSLKASIKPGDFVICDQMVDLTHGRDDTFYHGPEVAHISFAEPYCPEMRKIAAEACESQGITYHNKGTIVVVNGPRFSTVAESRWYTSNKWEVINMTQYPECVLAREMDMCYVNISLITDYDVGLHDPKLKPVTTEDVVRIFKENNENVKQVIAQIVKNTPEERGCSCGTTMQQAKL